MKNLLVDALRQAGGDSTPKADDTPPPAAEQPVESAASAGQGVEFELAESTVLPPSVRPTPSANHVYETPVAGESADDDTVREEPVDRLTESAAELATDADSETTDSIGDGLLLQEDDDVIDDPTLLVPALAMESLPGPAAAAPTPGGSPARLDWILLFGRWSPALCLLAMSAAAGSLAIYQRLAAETVNVDLGVIPGSNIGDGGLSDRHAGDGGWWDLLENDAVDVGVAPTTTTAATTPDPIASAAVVPPAVDELLVTEVSDRSLHDPAHATVQAAYDAYSRGDLATAESHYQDALAISPNHRHALKGYAAVLQKTDRIEAALDRYETLLTLDPKDTDAAAALLTYAKVGESESRLKVLLQRHPEAAALHFAMGLSMAGMQRWPEAHVAFLAAHERAPDNADYSFNVAVSAEHLGHLDVARRYYERALADADKDSLVDSDTIAAQLDVLVMAGGAEQ